MAKISPGIHSVRDLFAQSGFDFEGQAAADYNDGAPDFRRVKVGGLGFDDLDREVRVQPTADSVEITLDGQKVAELEVVLDEAQQEARRESFASSALAEDAEDDS